MPAREDCRDKEADERQKLDTGLQGGSIMSELKIQRYKIYRYEVWRVSCRCSRKRDAHFSPHHESQGISDARGLSKLAGSAEP